MDYDKALNLLKDELTKEGLNCIVQTSDDSLSKKLLIYCGEDYQKRMQLIELSVRSSEVKSPSNQTHTFMSFQFDAVFPFVVEDLATLEMAQFLHFLNLQVEIPGFYLNHIDNTILYRYVLFSENEMPKTTLLSLVGLIMFFQDVFGQTLERLAKGEVTFIELMEEIETIISKIPAPQKP